MRDNWFGGLGPRLAALVFVLFVTAVFAVVDCEYERAKLLDCPDKLTFTTCDSGTIECEERKGEQIFSGFFKCVSNGPNKTNCVKEMEKGKDGFDQPATKICWQTAPCIKEKDKCVADTTKIVVHWAYVYTTEACPPGKKEEKNRSNHY